MVGCDIYDLGRNNIMCSSAEIFFREQLDLKQEVYIIIIFSCTDDTFFFTGILIIS
jgi:hypothetical protein